jgi:transposase-like protein
VDKCSQTIDFLFTEQCDEQAAKRFLTKSIRRHRVPETVTVDGRSAWCAAMRSKGWRLSSARWRTPTTMVEWNYPDLKGVTCPVLGFKAFEASQTTLTAVGLSS